MPISVQQFDFIAASQGVRVALQVAEEAGGVTGTRDVATQIELGTGGVSGLSGTRLSGQGGQYMPGTVVTDLSQGIGAAGTATSGQTLGGGGVAADVISPGGRNIQDIRAMYAGDQPADLPNAPFTATTGTTMVHAYWGPGSPYAGAYIGLVSATDAASLTNANYEVRPGPPDLGAASPAEAALKGTPKYQIGDWVVNTDGNTEQVMSAQWLSEPGIWRYMTRGDSSEGSWNERRLSPGEAPTAETAAAATAEQSRWNSSYGAPGSQKAMDFFLEAYPSDEFSRITEAFKTYYSKEYAARVEADKGGTTTTATTTAAATTVNPGTAVIKSLDEGKVVRTSDLAKITDPATRTRAATTLANNIMKSLGNTQDAVSALGSLYSEYFNTPGGFGGWAESLGFKWDELEKPAEPVGGTVATTTAVYDSVGNRTMVPDDQLTNFLRDNPTFTLTPPSEETILGEGDPSIVDPSAEETMLGQGTLETSIGDAQTRTPAAMLNEIIEGLIAGSQTGVTPSNDEVIQQIMDVLGYSQSDASTIFFSTVKPEWQTGITTATPVPTGTTVPVPVPQFAPPVATQNIPREELFAAQGREDLQRRLLAGTFGTGLSPTGGRAARNIYNRFTSQLPIMEFGQGAQLPGPAFASFLANQPDPATLTAGLEAIQAGGAGNVFFEEAFPDVESVVGAGMQPFLMGLNPRLRPGIGNILRERALTAAAQAPETVVTPEDRMAMLGNIMQFRPPTSGFQGSNPTAFNWNQPASATGQWT